MTAVKAASTAALAADPSAVVAFSPNSPLPTGSNVIGALVSNQTINLNQVSGNPVNTGTGASGTGTQRVAVANDSQIKVWDGTNQATVKPASTATTATDTAVVVGLSPNSNQIQGTVANAASDSGNPVKIGGVYRSTTQTYSDGQRANLAMNLNGMAVIDSSATDVSGTFTTTGNTSAIDASGYGSIGFTLNVSAASGTTPTLDLDLQTSNDGVNDWTTQYEVERFTTTGSYVAARHSLQARYYRYLYTISGTSPSFTFTIRTDLKASSAPIIRNFKKYNDLNMNSSNNFSSTVSLEGCSWSTVTLTRGAGGAGVSIVAQYSNDGSNWVNSSSNTNTSQNSTYLISTSTGSQTKYMRFTNTNNQGAATTLDIRYYCQQ
ncbi:MAG TPA: hypothetical protein V6C65_15525 [Allocoleopsis sp.]